MSAVDPTTPPGPGIPPYEGPFDIPVLVDDRKELEGFRMTRCTFFEIEPTGTLDPHGSPRVTAQWSHG